MEVEVTSIETFFSFHVYSIHIHICMCVCTYCHRIIMKTSRVVPEKKKQCRFTALLFCWCRFDDYFDFFFFVVVIISSGFRQWCVLILFFLCPYFFFSSFFFFFVCVSFWKNIKKILQEREKNFWSKVSLSKEINIGIVSIFLDHFFFFCSSSCGYF